MEAERLLLIILSVVVIVQLIISIIAGILIIKFLKKVNQTAQSAKLAVENVETLVDSFKETAKITTVASAITKGVVSIFKAKRRK